MIATALAVAEASKEAIYSDEVLSMAKELIEAKDLVDEEAMMKLLFVYSATLTAVTANLVTSVLLTKEQMETMLSELQEFDELGKEMK